MMLMAGPMRGLGPRGFLTEEEKANRPKGLPRPQNLLSYFKSMQMDEGKRKMIASTLLELVP